MLRIVKLLGLGAAVVVLALAAGSREQGGWAQDCTKFVSIGESLQQVINNASSGEVICLGSGIWQERLEITKNLVLRGAGIGQSILDGSSLDSSVRGVTVLGSAQVRIEGVTIRNFGNDGVFATDQSQVTMRGAQISGNKGFGSIAASSQAQVTIQNSQISGNTELAGIFAEGQSYVYVVNSSIFSNEFGVAATSGFVRVENSQIYSNRGDGIAVGAFGLPGRGVILNNSIYNNGGYGVFAQSPDNILDCRGNSVYGNGNGNYNSAAAQRCR